MIKPVSILDQYNVVSDFDNEGDPEKKAWFLHPFAPPSASPVYESLTFDFTLVGFKEFEDEEQEGFEPRDNPVYYKIRETRNKFTVSAFSSTVNNRLLWSRFNSETEETEYEIQSDTFTVTITARDNEQWTISEFSGETGALIKDEEFQPDKSFDTGGDTSFQLTDPSPSDATLQADGYSFTGNVATSSSTSETVVDTLNTDQIVLSRTEAEVEGRTIQDSFTAIAGEDTTAPVSLVAPAGSIIASRTFRGAVFGGQQNRWILFILSDPDTEEDAIARSDFPDGETGTLQVSDFPIRENARLIKTSVKFGFNFQNLIPGQSYILRYDIEEKDYSDEDPEFVVIDSEQETINAPTPRTPDEEGDFSYLVETSFGLDSQNDDEPTIELPFEEGKAYRLANIRIYPDWSRIVDVPED